MSTVKATHFEHPSASSPGITLGADGSVVLPSGFTGGLGTNVVQTVKSDIFTTSSTSLVDITGLSATITPTSATSKILVVVDIATSSSTTLGLNLVQIVRDSTGIYEHLLKTDRTYFITNSSLVYLDSPATTSATVYKVQGRAFVGGGALQVNRAGDTAADTSESSITVIEVAA